MTGTCQTCGPVALYSREYIGKGFHNSRRQCVMLLCSQCGQQLAAYTPSPAEIQREVAAIRERLGLPEVEYAV